MIPVGILTAASTSSFSYLLNDYPGAAAAYSFRKLRSSYTGNSIRVQRSNDNAESDIGFVNNVLDTTALLTFVGVNNGRISKWYDQSGNGNDASNNIFLAQPIIVNAGVLVTQNGLPSSFYNNYVLDYLTQISSTANISTFIIGKADSMSTGGPMIGHSSPGGSGPNMGQYFGQYNVQNFTGANMTYNLTAANSANTNFIINNLYYNGTFLAYRNNTNIPITTTVSFGASTNNFWNIGRYGNGFWTVGYISEVIIYKLDQLSNRTGINANINSFYTIF
jgi:hypothetical protein